MSLSDEMKRTLIEVAGAARRWAYAPYSNYRVGAALLTASGRIYDGVNVENAAYPTSICAERVALFKAISEGEREFQSIAVVTANASSPCGACRQVLSEFAPELEVIISPDDSESYEVLSLRELLPRCFDSLGDASVDEPEGA